MQYLGGKSKIRKQIASYLESIRGGLDYFEPFVGGAWVLQEMSGKRIASDGNDALITMYKALQGGWVPPDYVSEAEYQAVRVANNPTDPMTIFCGIGCSFAGKLWGGVRTFCGQKLLCQNKQEQPAKTTPFDKRCGFPIRSISRA